MAVLKVDISELKDTAGVIERKNNEMKDLLTDMQRIVKNLKTSGQFESNTSNEFYTKIDAMTPKFNNYYEYVNNYSIFLKKAAERYAAEDAAGKANAAAQK